MSGIGVCMPPVDEEDAKTGREDGSPVVIVGLRTAEFCGLPAANGTAVTDCSGLGEEMKVFARLVVTATGGGEVLLVRTACVDRLTSVQRLPLTVVIWPADMITRCVPRGRESQSIYTHSPTTIYSMSLSLRGPFDVNGNVMEPARAFKLETY